MSENNFPIMQQDNAKGSAAIQAGVINLYPNGITEERCREICLSLYRDNIILLKKEAGTTAFQRAEQLTNLFIEKLVKQDDEIRKKIEEQLKEPAMQEAIFKSQKCFAMSGEDNHLNILTNMLIDRGNISQRNNRQMLIDEAIDTLPRLNQKHLNILTFFLTIYLEEEYYDEKILNDHIEDLIKYIKNALPLKRNDSNLMYLEQKKCLRTLFIPLKEINSILGDNIEILHSGFPKKEYEKLIHIVIPGIPFEKSLLKPENVVINTSLEKLMSILKETGIDKKTHDEIIHFYHRNRGENDLPLIKEYIIKKFEYGNLLFDFWDNIKAYTLSPLGIIIAQTYLKTKYQRDINWDFE